MCSVPVTFGGGSWMENEGLFVSSVGVCARRLPRRPQRASRWFGRFRKDFCESVMARAGTAGGRAAEAAGGESEIGWWCPLLGARP